MAILTVGHFSMALNSGDPEHDRQGPFRDSSAQSTTTPTEFQGHAPNTHESTDISGRDPRNTGDAAMDAEFRHLLPVGAMVLLQSFCLTESGLLSPVSTGVAAGVGISVWIPMCDHCDQHRRCRTDRTIAGFCRTAHALHARRRFAQQIAADAY